MFKLIEKVNLVNITVNFIFIHILAVDQIEIEQHSNDNNQIGYTISNDMIQIMSEQITTILAYVKRIDKKLETVGCNAESVNGNIDFLNLFPIKTVEAVQNIELKLTDITFEKQMVSKV